MVSELRLELAIGWRAAEHRSVGEPPAVDETFRAFARVLTQPLVDAVALLQCSAQFSLVAGAQAALKYALVSEPIEMAKRDP